jgi:hypothetical protein
MDIYQVSSLRPQQPHRVPPGVAHHFHSITAELRLLVVFAPAESSPA